MSIIKGFLYKYKKILIFIVLLIISIFLMFNSSKNAVTNFKKIGFSILSPFQFAFNSVGNFFQNTINSISQLKKTQEEINSLRYELEQYKKIISDINEKDKDINKLKSLLELKNTIPYTSFACEIIGRDPKNLFDLLIINKGEIEGLKTNMPVIGYSGGKRTLIGKIVETSAFASKVVTLQNPRFNVGSIILKNEAHTIIQGSNKIPGIIKLLYVPKDFSIQENDVELVFTSGDSLIFPKGIEIGRIVKIYQSKRHENFNEADIQIAEDLSKIDYVLVLKLDYKKDDFKLLEGLTE